MMRTVGHHTLIAVTPCAGSVWKKNFEQVLQLVRCRGKSKAYGVAWSGSLPELRRSPKVQFQFKRHHLSTTPTSLNPRAAHRTQQSEDSTDPYRPELCCS